MDILTKQIDSGDWVIMQRVALPKGAHAKSKFKSYFRVIKTPYNPSYWGSKVDKRGIDVIYESEPFYHNDNPSRIQTLLYPIARDAYQYAA